MSPHANNKGPSQVLAKVLLLKGILTREQLQQAVVRAKSSRRGLGHALVDLGLVPEAAIYRILAAVYKVQSVDVSRLSVIPAPVLETLGAEVAWKHQVLPLRLTADTLTVAVSNPADSALLAELSRASGLKIDPVISTDYAIFEAIKKYYGRRQADPAAPQPSNPKQPQRPTPAAASPPPIAAAPAAAAPAATAVPVAAVAPATDPASTENAPPVGQKYTRPAVPSTPDEGPDDNEMIRKQAEAQLMMINLDHKQDEKMSGGWGGMKLVLVGGAIIAIGVVATAASYMSAGEGGSFTVWYGLFLVGGAVLIRGLFTLDD